MRILVKGFKLCHQLSQLSRTSNGCTDHGTCPVPSKVKCWYSILLPTFTSAGWVGLGLFRLRLQKLFLTMCVCRGESIQWHQCYLFILCWVLSVSSDTCNMLWKSLDGLWFPSVTSVIMRAISYYSHKLMWILLQMEWLASLVLRWDLLFYAF